MKQALFSNKVYPQFDQNYNQESEDKILNFIDSLTFDNQRNHFNSFKKLIESKFLKLLNNKVIIIGGTNGKGEVSGLLSYLFSRNSKAVALWSSPHLMSIRERYCINGKYINYKSLENIIFNNSDISKELNYYEYLFYIFLLVIKDEDLDYLVLEVGVGGRLDVVNLFKPTLSIITNISRDHTKLLGNTYSKILNEKIKISRPDSPLVTCIESKYVNKLTKEYKPDSINLVTENYILLKDNYNIKNRILAQFVFNLLTNNKVKQSRKLLLSQISEYSDVRIWGRQIVLKYKNKNLYFIGAHNLDGIRNVSKYIYNNNLHFSKCYYAFSQKSEADLINLNYSLFILEDRISMFNYCNVKRFKSLSDNEINKLVKNYECNIIDENIKENIIESNGADEENILFTGSYYFIGYILSMLSSE